MAVLALALYGAFPLIAGGMRAFIQCRRTGDLDARHGRLGTVQCWGSVAPVWAASWPASSLRPPRSPAWCILCPAWTACRRASPGWR